MRQKIDIVHCVSSTQEQLLEYRAIIQTESTYSDIQQATATENNYLQVIDYANIDKYL